MSRRNGRSPSRQDAGKGQRPGAGYGRASLDEISQALSLVTQKFEIERFMAGRPDLTVVRHYEEYGTGSNDDRPEFQAMVASAEAGEIKFIVVQRFDRLARNLHNLLGLLERLDAAGCALYSVHESFDTGTISGRLGLHLLGAMGEFERKQLLQRIVGGQRAKVVDLKLPLSGRSIPFGTRINSETKKLEKDSDLADMSPNGPAGTWPIVERIFDSYLNRGLSPKLIAEALSADGLRTRSGGAWSRNRVDDILRNQGYIGKLRYKQEWIDDAHPPMLDVAMFQAVQDRLASNKVDHIERMATANKSHYLLSGILRCGSCGSSMVGNSTNNDGGALSVLRVLAQGPNPRSAWLYDRPTDPGGPA